MNSDQLIGIGLRQPHYEEILLEKPTTIGWLEIHSENLFSNSSLLNSALQISSLYPISLHGVGLSLGSADGVSTHHLQKLRGLIKKINPCFVSEHLSWGYVGGVYMHDLLPIPYTRESLDIFAKNLDVAQNFLQRELLIENPSSYLEYKSSTKNEAEFLVDLCKKTGAKILLDVNNIFVSSSNHGWDAKKYIDAIPKDLVKEIHVAGHSSKTLSSNEILRIDTHDGFVSREVWELYEYAITRFGPTATLLEWDANIPPLETLINEAYKAKEFLVAPSGLVLSSMVSNG